MTEEKRLSIQDILEDAPGSVDGHPVFRFKKEQGTLIVECGETYSVEIEFQEGFELSVAICKERESGDYADVVHNHTIDLEEGEAIELEEDDL